MPDILNFILSCLAGACMWPDAGAITQSKDAIQLAQISEEALNERFKDYYYGRSLSASYLSSRHAQENHDWDKASKFMDKIVKNDPRNEAVLNRAMVLAMGTGNIAKAQTLAKDILLVNEGNALASLMMMVEQFQSSNFDDVTQRIKNKAQNGLSDFVLPLVESWAAAASGELKVSNLQKNTIHLYHGILMADFLGKKDEIKPLLDQSINAYGLAVQDIERIADISAYVGDRKAAIALYEKIFSQWPENRAVANKLEAVRQNKPVKFIQPVTSAQQGLARAMYDMSRILFQEKSDESARVFAHLALYMDPSLTNANLLLGYITARHKNYEDAIAYYRKVAPSDPQYGEAVRMAADLMETSGMADEALKELERLTAGENDLEAIIQIGDIHRRSEEYSQAIKAYNRAASLLGESVPAEYWQLLYVRGIAYERADDWKNAEADLMQALAYQPNHPLILNYLGYAWADQGVHLEQSLEYVRRAATLQPRDGYITDSLGWVLYKMGRYDEALPHLERAVELMPYDAVINDHLGDVYWRVNRKLEARFQWQRAKNYAEDEHEDLIAKVLEKIENGLAKDDSQSLVKEAAYKSNGS